MRHVLRDQVLSNPRPRATISLTSSLTEVGRHLDLAPLHGSVPYQDLQVEARIRRTPSRSHRETPADHQPSWRSATGRRTPSCRASRRSSRSSLTPPSTVLPGSQGRPLGDPALRHRLPVQTVEQPLRGVPDPARLGRHGWMLIVEAQRRSPTVPRLEEALTLAPVVGARPGFPGPATRSDLPRPALRSAPSNRSSRSRGSWRPRSRRSGRAPPPGAYRVGRELPAGIPELRTSISSWSRCGGTRTQEVVLGLVPYRVQDAGGRSTASTLKKVSSAILAAP